MICQGADEELAGYHYFFGAYFKQLIMEWRFNTLLQEMSTYIRKYRSPVAFTYLGLYMAPSFFKNFLARQSHNYTTDDFYQTGRRDTQIKDSLYNPRTLNESLLQHFRYKLEHLLKWEDHNSMWFSLESRVPFLDHNIVEKTLSLPPERLINKATTKVILREAMKGLLPEKIRLRQDKIGFATPWEMWFRTEQFKEFTLDIIKSSSFLDHGYLDVKKCHNAFTMHREGKTNISKEIWKWVNLELWFQTYID